MVAVILFVVHCVTLVVLIGFSFVEFARVGFSVYSANLHVPPPQDMNAFALIFLGYSSAMLGITGFETSANFVEQQKKGVSYYKNVDLFPIISVICTRCSPKLFVTCGSLSLFSTPLFHSCLLPSLMPSILMLQYIGFLYFDDL